MEKRVSTSSNCFGFVRVLCTLDQMHRNNALGFGIQQIVMVKARGFSAGLRKKRTVISHDPAVKLRGNSLMFKPPPQQALRLKESKLTD